MWITAKMGSGAFALAFAVSLTGFSALADNAPFEIDSGTWMSSDHYEDVNVKSAPVQQPTPTPPAPASAMETDLTTLPGHSPSIAGISTAAMPGMNKKVEGQVKPTEDNREKEAPPVVAPDAEADIHIPDKDWKTPVPAARSSRTSTSAHQNADGDDDEQNDKPLNVRMSFLPSQNIVPTSSSSPESKRKLGHALMRNGGESVAGETAAPRSTTHTPSTCSAPVDPAKKQQLDAIQSDRETLKALQEAVHSLGAEKKLDLTPGRDGALNMSKRQTPSDAKSTPPLNPQ